MAIIAFGGMFQVNAGDAPELTDEVVPGEVAVSDAEKLENLRRASHEILSIFETTAWHEAGHALVAMTDPAIQKTWPVFKVTIIPNISKGYGGFTQPNAQLASEMMGEIFRDTVENLKQINMRDWNDVSSIALIRDVIVENYLGTIRLFFGGKVGEQMLGKEKLQSQLSYCYEDIDRMEKDREIAISSDMMYAKKYARLVILLNSLNDVDFKALFDLINSFGDSSNVDRTIQTLKSAGAIGSLFTIFQKIQLMISDVKTFDSKHKDAMDTLLQEQENLTVRILEENIDKLRELSGALLKKNTLYEDQIYEAAGMTSNPYEEGLVSEGSSLLLRSRL